MIELRKKTDWIYEGLQHSYAWPGGYPTFFVGDGFVLCHDCVQENIHDILESVQCHYRDGWKIECLDVNWESELYCGHCDAAIEAAYDVVEEG